MNNKAELLFESEIILVEYEKNIIDNKYSDILSGLSHLQGETKLREVKTRVNQYVFRQIVLTNYSNRCAITGIDIPVITGCQPYNSLVFKQKRKIKSRKWDLYVFSIRQSV